MIFLIFSSTFFFETSTNWTSCPLKVGRVLPADILVRMRIMTLYINIIWWGFGEGGIDRRCVGRRAMQRCRCRMRCEKRRLHFPRVVCPLSFRIFFKLSSQPMKFSLDKCKNRKMGFWERGQILKKSINFQNL